MKYYIKPKASIIDIKAEGIAFTVSFTDNEEYLSFSIADAPDFNGDFNAPTYRSNLWE